MAVKVELPQDFEVDEVNIENIRVGAEMKEVSSAWKRPVIYLMLPTDSRVDTLIKYPELYNENIVDTIYHRLNDEIRETSFSDGKGTYLLEFNDKFEKRIKETIEDILRAYRLKKTTIGI